VSNDGVNEGRRRVLTALTSVVGAAGVVGVAVPFVGSWNPSAKAKAAGAPVEVNISKLEPGQMMTVEWRGKPVYVLRRTPEALASLETVESRLRDPSSEDSTQPEYVKNRVRSVEGKEEIAVLLGLCTRGCVHPSAARQPTDQKSVRKTSVAPSGLAAFSAVAMVPNLTLPGAFFQVCPRPSIWKSPPINT